jgi:hypothetical protein
VTTSAAVATIRAAKLFVFLVPEGRTTIATVTSGNIDIGFVNELHGRILESENTKGPQGGPFSVTRRGASDWGDVHHVTVQRALDGELNVAIGRGKQGVILAHADVVAGVELGAALANDDGACAHQFATEGLDTQHLWLGITAVSRRAAAFFLCHVALLLNLAQAAIEAICSSVKF